MDLTQIEKKRWTEYDTLAEAKYHPFSGGWKVSIDRMILSLKQVHRREAAEAQEVDEVAVRRPSACRCKQMARRMCLYESKSTGEHSVVSEESGVEQ